MGTSDVYCALCGGPWCAEFMEDLPHQFKGGQYDGEEEKKEDEYIYGYDSTVIQEAQIKWLQDVVAMGRDPETKKCFITGSAEVDDVGGITAERSDDLNVSNDDDGSNTLVLDSYFDAIPIHSQCLHCILPKVLACEADNTADWVQSSMADVDLDKFYNCVEESLHDRHGVPNVLDLDYYEAKEASREQWWVSSRGQEALVADPIDIPQLREYYGQLPRHARPDVSDRSITQSSKGWMFDVFKTLPLETMTNIVENLPGTSLKELQAITPAAVKAMASEYSWKRRIKSDMPWLWDFPLEQALPCTETDWQKVYWDMDRRSTFQSSDAIPGLVNRRRIWKVCHQLAVMYAVQLHPVPTHSGGILEGLQRHSVSPYTRSIADVATNAKSHRIREFFLSDWSDLDTKSTYLQSYWNAEFGGLLTGLSVTMQGRPRRTFGVPSKTDFIKSLVLDPGNWIAGFNVAIDRGIQDLRVITKNRGLFALHNCAYYTSFPRLDLVPREGMTLVGLEGEMANGFISRIGVLECAKDYQCLDLAPLSLKKRLPWYDDEDTSVTDEHEAYPHFEGSWTSSALERPLQGMMPLTLAGRGCEIGSTLTSVTADIDLKHLDFYDSGTFPPITRPTDGIHTRKDWFAIEGSKGERIVGMEVQVTELPSAMRIVTSHGRQRWFGVPRSDAKRYRYVPKAGHAFAGLYLYRGYYDKKTDSALLSILSMLSAPGNNEGHLMREAPQDADGRFWVSAPPPQDWEPFGKVCGSTDAKVVTWLDLTDSISRIEGLVAAPADREIFDLDGIRIIPTTAEWELFNSKNDPSMGRTLKDDMEEDSELNEENFDPWRREQEKSIVIGTPPAPSPDQCIIQPTSDRFSYTADVSDGVKYKSDAEDAALPRTVDAGAQGHPWRVPMQKLTGLTVWSGTYLHGFQFHAGSGASSPFWGKCGGKPTARWNVNTSHDQGPESCVGLKFYLSDSRGPYRLQALKIVGIQRLVRKAARLSKFLAK